MSERPLAIDLFCGLGGWTEGLLAAGYFVVGFDIERHVYGGEKYPAHLVIQDVLTLHGSQFKDAALIVASPPCQFFSYVAMPWTRAKDLAQRVRADPEQLAARLELFNACWRIKREASAAAGHDVPAVIENVRGAIPWVGRAAWNFGSYYLWGDVPALMPSVTKAGTKVAGMDWSKYGTPGYKAVAFNDEAVRQMAGDGRKVPGFRFDGSGRSFQTASVGAHVAEGRKGAGAGAEWFDQNLCKLPSASPRRKHASAKIAKIPLVLSAHIARVYLPRETALHPQKAPA